MCLFIIACLISLFSFSLSSCRQEVQKTNVAYVDFPRTIELKARVIPQDSILFRYPLVSGKLLLRIRKYLINNIFRGQTPVHDLKCLHLQSVS